VFSVSSCFFDKVTEQSTCLVFFLIGSTQPLSNQEGNATADVGRQTDEIPAQEIMAITRAKLAKLRVQNQIEPLIDGSGASSKTLSISSAAANRTEPISSTMRTRLLQRLEEEKRSVVNNAVCEEDKTPSEIHADDTTSKSEPPQNRRDRSGRDTIGRGNTDSSNPENVEKRLRAQALLRARLAAEKKKIGNN
jgi:hypothetical protein